MEIGTRWSHRKSWTSRSTWIAGKKPRQSEHIRLKFTVFRFPTEVLWNFFQPSALSQCLVFIIHFPHFFFDLQFHFIVGTSYYLPFFPFSFLAFFREPAVHQVQPVLRELVDKWYLL